VLRVTWACWPVANCPRRPAAYASWGEASTHSAGGNNGQRVPVRVRGFKIRFFLQGSD
jgi:hypothetical protein